METIECENEELKLERSEFIEKIDGLKAEVKISRQEKAEAVRNLKQMESENKELKSRLKILNQKIVDGVKGAKELKCEIEKMKIEKNEWRKKITFLESLQTFLREKIQNHENTISELHRLIDKQKADLVFLKTMLSDENEMTMNHLHQIFSLKEQIAELQKKPKPFFRWLLTGIWIGFSNLCGRFRDHFMRRNIYWKLFYISIFLSLIGRFLEKEPVKKTTETICEMCSRRSRYIRNQDFVY